MFTFSRHGCLAAVAGLAGLVGCERPTEPIGRERPSFRADAAPTASAPTPLVTIPLGTGTLAIWPFTGLDFSGTPFDPINLIFLGRGDPRSLRAGLLELSGDRSAYGFPNAPPFNCTWQDAIGDVETAYAVDAGWLGSAVQLACGEFGPLRVHLRFFDAGIATLGGAHFEVQIPGTATHEVLSWELAEQLVVVDFLRGGLLDPAAPLFPTGPINPAPWRAINPFVYNALPIELRAAIGGPLDDQSSPIPIGTDGSATVLNVAAGRSSVPGVAVQEFDVQFGQVIPKPFCASGPFDFLDVHGPVQLRLVTILTSGGNYISSFHAHGRLDITPVNPSTDPPTPIGATYEAQVNQIQHGILTDRVTRTSSFILQSEIPSTGPFRGRLIVRLDVGPGGVTRASAEASCEP